MCGISGILSSNPDNIKLLILKQMTDSISHRGPDGEGQWINESGTVGLGHRRLSIIDLSENSNQPMHYLSRYSIVFNGEIYNYIEIKTELQKNGYVFKTNSDTEVLMALYDLKKENCLADLDGMFSFVLWDNKEKVAFCARDRFGEKPFFYHQTNDTIYFASEMKALWTIGIPKEPNLRRVFLYLGYNAQDDIHNPSTTFYKNIFLLEAAHYLIIKDAKIIRHKKYWSINTQHKKHDITLIQAKEIFNYLFEQSIRRRLRADVFIGSSLSGGLDSSSIVAVINRLKDNDQKQKTFSARFEGFERDEGKYIDMVVSANKVQSYQIFLTPELLNKKIEEVAYYQEEPFGSTSVIAQWEVMKLAKEEKVTVLLDGQGADEYLAGYKPYFINYFSSLRLTNNKVLKEQIKSYNTFYNTKFDKGKYFFLHAKFPSLRNKLRNLKNIFVNPPYLKQFNKDFLNEFNSFDPPYEYPVCLDEALQISISKRGLNNLLRYADRNSMAHSREVRLPFLSHELVEFVFSLPDSYKLNNGWTKVVLREAMNTILPQEICWRKEKVGFEPPKYRQIDKDLAEAALDILYKNKIINPKNKLVNINWDYFQVSKLY